MKKYRSERKGRRSPVPDGTGRSFDAALEYDAAGIIAGEEARARQPVA